MAARAYLAGLCGTTDLTPEESGPARLGGLERDDLAVVRSPGFALAHAPRGTVVSRHAGVLCALSGYVTDARFPGDQPAVAATLARAWAEEGPQVLRQINGYFALALCDEDARRVVLLCSPFAAMPQLSYASTGDRFAFATEATAAARLLGAPTTVDEEAVAQFLELGTVVPPLSMISGVRTVLPGHMITWDKGVLTCEPAYEFDLEAGRPLDEEALADSVASLVRLSCSTHGQVGLLLSGGIDSGMAAALAQFAVPEADLHALSMGFHESEHDETWAARAVAEGLGLSHQVLYPAKLGWRHHMAGAVQAMPHPMADPSIVVSHMVAHAARKVVGAALAADGPDHCLGRHVTSARAYQLSATIPGMRLLARAARAPGLDRVSAGLLRGRKHGKALEVLASGSVGEAYRRIRRDIVWRGLGRARSVFAATIGDRIRQADWAPGLDATVNALFRSSLDYDHVTGWDLVVDGVCGVFLKTAVAASANDLDLYEPFLLPRAAAAMLQTPPSQKSVANWSGTTRTEYKVALREMARRFLPADIIDKPKHGFTLPLVQWLRDEWAGRPAREALPFLADQGWLRWDVVEREWGRHMAGDQDCSTFLFALLVLEQWLLAQRW